MTEKQKEKPSMAVSKSAFKTLQKMGIKVERTVNTRTKKLCRICKLPMLVAPGQIAYYHKACRKLRNKKNR